MNEKKTSSAGAPTPTRRQVVTGVALAFGGLAARSKVWGEPGQTAAETKSPGADTARTFLHQEVDFKASPKRIYEVLLDSKQFSAFSGEPAEISRDVGGPFSTFGGRIVGRNIELVPNQRIVQAWRPASWDPGVYSIVRFELKEQDPQTRVVLDHTGFPEGSFGHLDPGWHRMYWEPLRKFLG
jgi:activator of HSP90 ATPase